MRVENQSRFLFVWLMVAIFGLVSINTSRAAPLDLKTVEVAYLFNKGNGNVAKDISGNGRDGDITGQSMSKVLLETV